MRYSNPICDLAKIDALLAEYRQSVEHLEQDQPARELKLSIGRVLSRYGVSVEDLFHALLQQFDLKPKLRREVEEGARFWNRFEGGYPSAARRAFMAQPAQDSVAQLKATLEVAERARKQGTPHAACLVSKAHREVLVGGFRVINTGGFDKKKMTAVGNVVRAASKRLLDHGFGSVLYGEINVTNKLAEENELAFYQRRHDAMFVRADVRMGRDAVHTVIHELAHRLEGMYVIVDGGIEDLYDATKARHREAAEMALLRIQMVAMSGKPAIADGHVTPEYRAKFWYFVAQYGGFVSTYAATSPSENFAEMVAVYCMGDLPKSQQKRLLDVIPEYVLNLMPPAEHAQKLVDEVGREKAVVFADQEVAKKTWNIADAIEGGALAKMEMWDLVQKNKQDRALSRYWTEVRRSLQA